MTQSDLDSIHDAYLSAVHELVVGTDGISDRLDEAFHELRKVESLGNANPADEFRRAVTKDLAGILESGRKLETLGDSEREELAWRIWTAQRDIAFAAKEADGPYYENS